jgi:hypothetical protein
MVAPALHDVAIVLALVTGWRYRYNFCPALTAKYTVFDATLRADVKYFVNAGVEELVNGGAYWTQRL